MRKAYCATTLSAVAGVIGVWGPALAADPHRGGGDERSGLPAGISRLSDSARVLTVGGGGDLRRQGRPPHVMLR
jgi:hypothetical protein